MTPDRPQTIASPLAGSLALLLAVTSVALGLTVAGCGETAETTSGPTRTVATSEGDVEVPSDPQRVVALGEEFLLSDLLSLGIKPIASTATLGTEFSGIPAEETDGIEPLDVALLDPLQVAELKPDLLVVDEFVLGQAGYGRLSKIAPTVPVASDDWRADVGLLGETFGREDEAAGLLDDYDAAVDAGRDELGEGVEASVATAYPSEVVAWTDGPSTIPATLLDLGVTLVPGADDDLGPLDAGRVSLSRERLDLLSAPTLFLLQSSSVEGEDAAVDRLEDSSLYQSLPAVESDRVMVLDRLAYPGVEGRIAAAKELTADLAP